MRLIIVLALTISFNTFAAGWNDLEIDQTYELKQNIELTPQVELKAGEKVYLSDAFSLDMIRVMFYKFEILNCPGKDLTSGMQIIPVQGTSPVVEAGAQLEKNCVLEVYLETRDIYSESLFQ